jgi:membrane protein DedA with SNARE-associated domain
VGVGVTESEKADRSAPSDEAQPPGLELDAADRAGLPPEAGRAAKQLWEFAFGTWLGLLVLALVVYVGPYGLGSIALSFEVARGGEFALIGFAALVATAYASSLPAPTPLLGTLSLVLAAVLGANFDPISAGVAGGLAQAVGLLTCYFAGLAGLAPTMAGRLSQNRMAAAAIERAGALVRRRGESAEFVLALVPNPLVAYASVFSGAVPMPWMRFVLVVTTGSLGRFLIAAFLGAALLA